MCTVARMVLPIPKNYSLKMRFIIFRKEYAKLPTISKYNCKSCKNRAKSMECIKEAAKLGHEGAQKLLNEMNKKW